MRCRNLQLGRLQAALPNAHTAAPGEANGRRGFDAFLHESLSPLGVRVGELPIVGSFLARSQVVVVFHIQHSSASAFEMLSESMRS